MKSLEISNWDKIPVDSYKFIFERAKEAFEQRASESESITNKSIKMLSLFVILGGAIVVYGLNTNIYVLTAFIILYGFNLYCIIELVWPKGIIYRGNSPISFDWDAISSHENNSEEKVLATYLNEIERLGDSINHMDIKNEERQKTYKIAIAFTSLLFVAGIACIVICHPL